MDCSHAVLTLFLLVPCDPGGGHSGAVATPPDMDLARAEAPASPARIQDGQVGDCFVIESEISVLGDSADDHAPPVSAQNIPGRTDRVICKIRQ